MPSKRMVGTYHPNNFFFDGDVGDGELSSAREANSGPFDMKRVNNVYTTARKLYSQVGKIYSCPGASSASSNSCGYQCGFNLCSGCYIARFHVAEPAAKRQKKPNTSKTQQLSYEKKAVPPSTPQLSCNGDDAHKIIDVSTLDVKQCYEVPNEKWMKVRWWLSRCSPCGLKWYDRTEEDL